LSRSRVRRDERELDHLVGDRLLSTAVMPGKRDFLSSLTGDELLTLVDRFDLDGDDRRVKLLDPDAE